MVKQKVKDEKEYIQYKKDIAVLDYFDVVVCGAGMAGFCAAVQAARAGAKTALVEQYGTPGGVLTVGGNNEIGLFYRGSRQIIAGIGWELVKRLEAEGWASIPNFDEQYDHSQQNVVVNGPLAAAGMDTMCQEAGVSLLYHHTVCDAMTENNRVTGVLVATKSGLRAVQGSCFIDATGDGELAALAGAAFQLGEGEPPVLQPGTLRFYWSDFRLENIDKQQVEECFRQGLETGEIHRADYWALEGSPYSIFYANGNNINHISLNGADSLSCTQAEVEGRRSVARLAAWARKRVKGAENIQPVACGGEVAVRESRRIVGEHTITVEEYLRAASYPDGVCYSYYPVDLHVDGEQTLCNVAVNRGAVPQIPLGALVVKGFDNLLVAGRCASGDRLAQSAFRVKASCMAMGQAAGAAAALSIEKKLKIKEIPVEAVRSLLRAHGAIVP